MPLFWEAADGTPVVDEWAIGFMRAVSLRADAWDPVLKDEDSAILLIPIGIVAGQALGEEDPQLRIPEEAMDDLMEDGDMMMAACAVGRLRQDAGPVGWSRSHGDPDVEGLVAQLAVRGVRTLMAAKWPVADTETSRFVAAAVEEYLDALPADGPPPPFARARAANRARRRCGDGFTEHVAAGFEVYGCG